MHTPTPARLTCGYPLEYTLAQWHVNSGCHKAASALRCAVLNACLCGCQVYGPGAVESLMTMQMLETLAVNGCRGMSDPTVKQLQQELPCLKHVRGL